MLRAIEISLILLCLAGLSAAQDMDALRSAVASQNKELKRDVLLRIRNLHTEAASRIAVPGLKDPDEMVRAVAAAAIVSLPKDEAARDLVPLLADKAPFVRAAAAFALGDVGDRSATKPLVHLLQRDAAPEVRSAAAVALGEIGDVGAVEALTAIFKKSPSEDNEFLRRSAARSIGQIAETATAMISTGTASASPGSLTAAKPQAVEIFPGFRPAVPVLIKVLQNPKETDDTHREAAFALGAAGDASAAGALRSNLNAKDNYLAEICQEALRKIGSQQ